MALDPRVLISLTRNSSADITISTGTFIELLTDNNNKPITYNDSYIALILPDTYTRVPYLESTGTQYINTGFIPTTDFKHTLVFEVTSDSNSNKYICGSGVSEGRSGNLRINGNTLNGLYINKSSAVSILSSTQTIQLNTKYIIVMDLHPSATNTVTLNGTNVGNTSTGTIDSTKPLYLWSLSNSYLPIGVRIYSSKIEQQNGQSYYFIPARRNSDSILGMYDLISGTFKINSGTGSFITEE